MSLLLAFLGVFVIGLSKAGFATGLGMLSTPLMAQALPARTAIGVILPLLCLADVFTLAVYWRRWDLRLVAWPLVGTLIGIAAATGFVTSISDLALRRSIGGVGLVLTLLLIVRNRYHPHAVYRPRPWHGVLVGVAAGVSSTIAHAAGPILALFLLAQRLDKTSFVATSGVVLHGQQPAQGPALRRHRPDRRRARSRSRSATRPPCPSGSRPAGGPTATCRSGTSTPWWRC